MQNIFDALLSHLVRRYKKMLFNRRSGSAEYNYTGRLRTNADNKIVRNGQMKVNVVCDGNGDWFLMGGICIMLDPYDTDLELHGVDENGWNGTVEAVIDGNGRIILEPEIKLEDDEYVFIGDISPEQYIPYQTSDSSDSDTVSTITSSNSGPTSSDGASREGGMIELPEVGSSLNTTIT